MRSGERERERDKHCQPELRRSKRQGNKHRQPYKEDKETESMWETKKEKNIRGENERE